LLDSDREGFNLLFARLLSASDIRPADGEHGIPSHLAFYRSSAHGHTLCKKRLAVWIWSASPDLLISSDLQPVLKVMGRVGACGLDARGDGA
jgi:hypothetical protein